MVTALGVDFFPPITAKLGFLVASKGEDITFVI